MTPKEEDIWKNLQFPIITGKLNEEKYANKRRESILDDIINDKDETDFEKLDDMEKDFREGLPAKKTIASELISVRPSTHGPDSNLFYFKDEKI